MLSFVGLGTVGGNSGAGAREAVNNATGNTTYVDDVINSIPDSMMTMVIIGVIIGSIIAICWTLFILYPLEVGRCRYFMESRQSLTPPPPRWSACSATPTATPLWFSFLPI